MFTAWAFFPSESILFKGENMTKQIKEKGPATEMNGTWDTKTGMTLKRKPRGQWQKGDYLFTEE